MLLFLISISSLKSLPLMKCYIFSLLHKAKKYIIFMKKDSYLELGDSSRSLPISSNKRFCSSSESYSMGVGTGGFNGGLLGLSCLFF